MRFLRQPSTRHERNRERGGWRQRAAASSSAECGICASADPRSLFLRSLQKLIWFSDVMSYSLSGASVAPVR